MYITIYTAHYAEAHQKARQCMILGIQWTISINAKCFHFICLIKNVKTKIKNVKTQHNLIS